MRSGLSQYTSGKTINDFGAAADRCDVKFWLVSKVYTEIGLICSASRIGARNMQTLVIPMYAI